MRYRSSQEIKLLKAQITKLKKQAKPVIKHFKAYLKTVSLQRRLPRKSSSKKHRVHKESIDNIDHMENRKCQMLRRIKRNWLSGPIVSTDGSKVSTDEQVEGTEEHNEGTEEIFESTEEQRPGTEEKVESTAGQIKGPTSTRSLLTLKPLPKIDPKDKGKKKIEEEDESESEDDDILKLVT
ncbi:hypothetical protein Tco_0722603 [Tanacetum coccineum]